MTTVLVSGAGGMIGGHLVNRLVDEGFDVKAVDIKPLEHWYQINKQAKNYRGDLTNPILCHRYTEGVDHIYNLAADMGGIGFIEGNKAKCMLSVLINTNLLNAAKDRGVSRYFYSSSACVYAADKQLTPDIPALREEDAYPAMPEDGYGWEKLFSERMCRHFYEDFGIETRVARYHNIYGTHLTYDGGREKAPAAICRKVIEAKLNRNNEIWIWGDGNQTRSFTWMEDCIEGTRRILDSDCREPLNVGSSELVTINELVDMVEDVAGISLFRRYDLSAPQGVRGRNSDNTKILSELGWEPQTRLYDGLIQLYDWIYYEMTKE